MATTLRHVNRLRILGLIRHHREIARNRLAKETGLSPSTVSNIVRSLMDEGVVIEARSTPTGHVGRDPVGVALNPGAHTAIGIQIADSLMIGVLLDFRGTVRRRIEEPLSLDGRPTQRVSSLINRIVDMVALLRERDSPVLGVGVAVAGMVHSSRHVVFAPNIYPEAIELESVIAGELGLSVVVENEANTMLLAEQSRGVAASYCDVLGVNVGLGIGGGLILGGVLYRGATGSAAEIGHTVLEIDGPPCSCGSRGCLETLAGGKALLENGTVNRDLPKKRLLNAARYLGVGIANAVNISNPSLVVLGGSHISMFDSVAAVLETSFNASLLPPNSDVVLARVTVADAEALGAGMLILNDYFESPEIYLETQGGARPTA